jgi:hypothetical protein
MAPAADAVRSSWIAPVQVLSRRRVSSPAAARSASRRRTTLSGAESSLDACHVGATERFAAGAQPERCDKTRRPAGGTSIEGR